ncbi:MAG: sialidase family protein [Myxococcota bacterium]
MLATPTASNAPPPEIVRRFVFERATFAQCHAATLAFAGDTGVAAWFGGTREGASDVDIWSARFQHGRWSEPERVATGQGHDGRPWPCWNPVLHADGAGGLELFYKVGPSPRRWWGMHTRSHDGGRTWQAPTRLPQGFLGPVKNKPLALDDGRLLCGSSREGVGWRIHLEWLPRRRAPLFGPRSIDTAPGERPEPDGNLAGAERWEQSGPLNRGLWLRAIQPALLRHGDGRLQLLCRTRSGRVAESWSSDGGRHWERLRLTSLPDAASGLDAVTLRDGRHLLVYNHSRRGRSPLNVAISEDGRSWSAAAVIEEGHGEYSYPAVVEGPDGRVHVLYTWRRERIRHAELDVEGLEPRPIESGRWPAPL